MELYNGPLSVEEILNRWYADTRNKNYGAMITFVGTVREEGGIEALSFDIYEPMLRKWFDAWTEKAAMRNVRLAFAHSIGDVPVHTTSYIAGVFSPQRRAGLETLDEYVEDFKANAPIWKYDVVGGERVFAEKRSHQLPGSGLLKG